MRSSHPGCRLSNTASASAKTSRSSGAPHPTSSMIPVDEPVAVGDGVRSPHAPTSVVTSKNAVAGKGPRIDPQPPCSLRTRWGPARATLAIDAMVTPDAGAHASTRTLEIGKKDHGVVPTNHGAGAFDYSQSFAVAVSALWARQAKASLTVDGVGPCPDNHRIEERLPRLCCTGYPYRVDGTNVAYLS